MDACHVACAILAECDFFFTADKRLLKYQTDEIRVMNPAAVKKGAGVQAVPRKRIAKLLGADLLVFTAKQSAPFFIFGILGVGVEIGTYACIVFEFLVDLIIAFYRRVRYTWPTK